VAENLPALVAGFANVDAVLRQDCSPLCRGELHASPSMLFSMLLAAWSGLGDLGTTWEQLAPKTVLNRDL
jgi:hypothetical protein